jgi:hypothetical protein
MRTFNLSELAVRERAVTLFLIIAIAVAGTFAFFKLGRAEDPTFTIKVLTVTTAWLHGGINCPSSTRQTTQRSSLSAHKGLSPSRTSPRCALNRSIAVVATLFSFAA